MASRFYRPEYVARYGEPFARAVAFVLERETEFNRDGSVRVERDPSDPGGTTKYGIDARSHRGVDVPNLTEAQAVAIYHATEWARVRGDNLPAGLALPLLDTAVNPSMNLTPRWLQGALGLIPDSVIGPQTLAAAAALDAAGVRRVALDIQTMRENYYRALPAYIRGKPFGARYLPGWLARVELTRAAIKAA